MKNVIQSKLDTIFIEISNKRNSINVYLKTKTNSKLNSIYFFIVARVINFNEIENSICQSVQGLKLSMQNPGELLINALQNESANEPLNSKWYFGGPLEQVGDSKIFLLIKPKQRQNVEIAQQTAKWIFAPQTEKKILSFKSVSIILFTTITGYILICSYKIKNF